MHARVAIPSLLLPLLLAAALPRPAAAADVDYLTQVKPILTARCTMCHGALKQKAGLRLDAGQLVLKGGKHGAVVQAGKAGDSVLVHAISGGTNGASKMPEEGEPLKPDEVALIRRWIDEGAKVPADEPVPAGPEAHWSFKPPVRPAPPAVRDAAWVKNPIDAFVAAEHARRGLTPRPDAERHVLLRRVTIDLTGLPPTPDELRAFAADPSPDAYEKVVDRLLASPAYGERWGRHWMDVWRYSDWSGYAAEVRNSQPHVWRWRDWIVESLNADVPYDRMVREMLAADEVAPADPQALRATGYLVRSWFKFNRNTWMEDVVEHTAKAFLGMTFNCAKCHDHMYDPVSQREYYQFRAVFEPYDLRTDVVPGGTLDTKAAGLVRVSDLGADRPTFLLLRGDERQPKKDEPLPPGVPAALGGGKFNVAKVDLPPAAYYPGLAPHVREATLAAARAAAAAAEQEVAKSEAALAKAGDALAGSAKAPTSKPTVPAAAETAQPKLKAMAAPAAPTTAPAGGNVELVTATNALRLAGEAATIARLTLDAARAEVASVEARIAADDARYAAPPRPNAESLALAAGRAERRAGLCKAELNAEAARHAMLAAQLALKGGEAKPLKVLADAGLKVVSQQAALDAARANLDQPSPQYTPITPTYPATSTGRRTALASWVTSRDNPLAARVAVNHIWMRHFGAPLVPTVFDFGLNGRPPTHPALLDWLAVELMDRGWSMKHLHRLMVTSTAYRMRSDAGSDAAAEANRRADPDNVYLWRANLRRMEAEVVRDSVLALAGSLDPTFGGPDLPHAQGLTSNRRSLYFQHAPEKQMTFLATFDAASTTECYRREESVMPQQALALVNSSLALAQSRKLAAAITNRVSGAADAPAAFVDAAVEQVLNRRPTEAEREACVRFLAEQAGRLARTTELEPFGAGEKAVVPPSWDPNQRARENLVHVLFNHNDFVTIR